MPHDRKYLLGVGIDSLTTTSAVERIIQSVSFYEKDQQARYSALVDDDICIHVNGWSWNQLRDRETAEVLRGAQCLLAQGSGLHRASRWIEEPLKEKIEVRSLLETLAERAAQCELSLYLLGRHEGDALGAAAALQHAFPKLKIVGTAAFHPAIVGEDLLEAPERDALVIEEINQAHPSILLIDFGIPTAELWFSRVQQNLCVPLTLSTDGGFASLSRCRLPSVEISPFQKMTNFFQMLFMEMTACCFQRFSQGIYQLYYSRLKNRQESLKINLFVSQTRTIAVLKLPTLVDGSMDRDQNDLIEQAFSHDHLVVDFQSVNHITLEGINFLCDLWLHARGAEKEISGLAMSGDIRLLLKVNRVWDLLGEHQYRNNASLVSKLQQARHNSLYEALEQDDKSLILSFLGQLDNHQNYERLFQQLVPIVQRRPCTLDLTYCSAIEGRGCSFLLRLQKSLKGQENQLYLYGLSSDLKWQFRRLGLLKKFDIQMKRS